MAVGCVAGEEGIEFGEDLGFVDVFSVELHEAGSFAVAAKIEVVFAGGFTHEGDFGEIGAGASVGAAGHADGDGLVAESVLVDERFEARDEVGQVAFGFCHGEGAGGQGNACHAVFAEWAGITQETVLAGEGFNGFFVLCGDLGNHEVLGGGDAVVAAMEFTYFE